MPPSLVHTCVRVRDIEASLCFYHPGGRDDLPRIAFVADPDGYRVELIDGGTFETPQDGPHPSA